MRFGNPPVMRERTTESDGALWLEGWWTDVRVALRQLAKSPGLAITAVLAWEASPLWLARRK